jgi:hypothetical protein
LKLLFDLPFSFRGNSERERTLSEAVIAPRLLSVPRKEIGKSKNIPYFFQNHILRMTHISAHLRFALVFKISNVFAINKQKRPSGNECVCLIQDTTFYRVGNVSDKFE